MSKDIKVSIIIPAYNAAVYIRKCLESIVAQTIFDQLQVIVVNDGSTDGTEKILEEYDRRYSNISVITTSNRGVSNARNVGIQYAEGAYITFVDADDWVDRECYEKMLINAVKTQADIVAAGFIINQNAAQQSVRKITDINHIEDNVSAAKSLLLGILDVHVCDKLFRAEIAKMVKFELGIRRGEDRLFLLNCLFQAKNVCFINEAYYHYFQNEQSVMHEKLSVEIVQCTYYVANQVKDRCSRFFSELVPYAEAMYISDICRLYSDLSEGQIPQELKSIVSNCKKEIQQYPLQKAVKYMSRKHLIALILAKINPGIVRVLRKNTYLRFMK